MTQTATCYIIDDSEIDVFMLERIIAQSETICQFKKFNNGQAAHQALRASAEIKHELPLLIILDLNMPICDGWQFLDAVRDIPKIEESRIIVVSSTNDPAEQERVRRDPLVEAFIEKPISAERLNDYLFT